jgi:hypothetical protein
MLPNATTVSEICKWRRVFCGEVPSFVLAAWHTWDSPSPLSPDHLCTQFGRRSDGALSLCETKDAKRALRLRSSSFKLNGEHPMMLLNGLERAWSVATTKHSNPETKHQPVVSVQLRHSLDAGLVMPRNIGIIVSLANHAFGSTSRPPPTTRERLL